MASAIWPKWRGRAGPAHRVLLDEIEQVHWGLWKRGCVYICISSIVEGGAA